MSRRRKFSSALVLVAIALARPRCVVSAPATTRTGRHYYTADNWRKRWERRGNGGGNGGGGGGGHNDTLAPQTTITMTGPKLFVRSGVPYYYPNMTVTLRATDNASLATIVLNDTETSIVFPVNGTAAEVSIVMTTMGQHWLQYYSIDKAGNKETPHSETAGISRPELADLLDIIENSNIDNDGIKNALSAKVRAAQHHLDMGHSLNTLNALMNQLDAIEGKHGLDSETVRSILAIIAVMMP